MNRRQKIINGDTAEIGEYPWMAALYITREGRTFFNCGGTLIDERTIITAAHCVDE